ncbi:MAG: HAMP domain-containing sensor histidine kinase [Gemmataceae bacterium]
MATDPSEVVPEPDWRRVWRYGRALVAPVLIWLLLGGLVLQPLLDWLHSEETYDRAAIQEWIEEARNADATLGDLVSEYAKRTMRYLEVRESLRELKDGRVEGPRADPTREDTLFLEMLALGERVAVRREEIYQHLRALGEPATKMYPGQLPLFPIIYRLEVRISFPREVDIPPVDDAGPALGDGITWESGLEPSSGQYRETTIPLRVAGTECQASVVVRYQLRAWNKRQRDEEQKARRVRQLGLLAVAATILGVAWLMLLQADERESQRHRDEARHRIDLVERQRLDEERRRIEIERALLEQQVATQAAEQKALELKSHLYASIGIMAGSYAHNIKNLLVRPNDLLRRCLEPGANAAEQEKMLREIQQTLGLVTERLQQILHTVRRDPSTAESCPVDLAAQVTALGQTWGQLAASRWQLDLDLEPPSEPLWIRGDESHLQQAIENLLFNARDATFEMRNHLREEARRKAGQEPSARRQALIAAASWRGRVVVRLHQERGSVVLEVSDNGAGMSPEVLARCTEAHFSTKRENALYEGHSTGMGLGLSFVASVLENHRARMEITSVSHQGTTFRIRFPANSTRSVDE